MKNTFFVLLLLSILTSINLKAESAPEGTVIGAGIGYNFGVFGASIDIPIVDNSAVTFALGKTPDSTAFNIGYRYYFKEQNVLWRPRVTLQYGTNGVIEKGCWIFSCDDETFEGISLGIGQVFSFGQSRRHGLTLDLILKLSDGGMDNRQNDLENDGWITDDDNGDVSISVGYKYRFRSRH